MIRTGMLLFEWKFGVLIFFLLLMFGIQVMQKKKGSKRKIFCLCLVLPVMLH